MFHLRTALRVLVVGLLWSSAPVAAQPLGTFRWQQQPYCNVFTLVVEQKAGSTRSTGSTINVAPA